jgi:nucleoid-associated protein YgaU
MSANVQIPAPQTLRKVIVCGGNLFDLALAHLGDPLQWTRIAALNGLGPDPWLPANVMLELAIPPTNTKLQANGILGA